MGHYMNRRIFLHSAAAITGSAIAPTAFANKISGFEVDKELHLYNIHTGEFVKTTFYNEGQYNQQGLNQLDHLLRDHRSGESTLISRTLLDDIPTVQQLFKPNQAIEIISGYRSPKTNEKLRAMGHGVAKRSLHMQGKAIDIRIPGINLRQVRKAALALKSGGVGYYPKSGFIHLDVGRVRQWGS
jgi:uncharacterized protein YcbK (DUF882 family)